VGLLSIGSAKGSLIIRSKPCNDGTEASRPCEPDDGDDQMKEKDDDIAHPAMVSKP
jgi:hypothetical protein